MINRQIRNEPGEAQGRLEKRHYPALQSARGLAALAVLLCHSLLVFETSGGVKALAQATEPVAHIAVVFFFVLSGFVLMLSLLEKPLTGRIIIEFYVRRFARILPALWVACLIATAVLLLAGGYVVPNGASVWFQSFYQPGQFRFSSIMASFTSYSTYLVPPGWSIFVEIFASLTFPLIVAFERKGFALPLLAFGLVLALTVTGHLRIGTYWFCFVAGAALFNRLAHHGIKVRWAAPLVLIGIMAVIIVRLCWTWEYHNPLFAIAETALAVVAVGTLVRRAPRLMTRKPIVRLGDISYSVYILHFPIIAGLALLIDKLSLERNILALVFSAGAIIVTVGAAEVSYRFVERPGIAVGKAITRMLGAVQLGRRADATPP